MTVQFIDTSETLQNLCKQLTNSEWLAIDTEFLREKTYYPQLCLIQIANENLIACIDPLMLDDLSPLLNILYAPHTTLVFHAARQDLELLYLIKDELPQNLFDTQLAATVLGYGDQIGYGKLVKQCLDVDLDKAHSRTDWTQRPLDPAQVEYAADDVRYLRELYPLLKQELVDKGRLTWLADDFLTLSNANTYAPSPETIWRKIKGAGGLKGQQLAILQRLASWRETLAINSNRPRRWILKDDVLTDLARLSPTSNEKLKKIRGLDSGTINRHGESLIAEINEANKIPRTQWPNIHQPEPLTNKQNALIDALMALLRHYCDQQSITPAAVATRKEIEKLVRGNRGISLLQGWRNEIIGQYLDQFLKGELNITADPQQLHTHQKG